MLHNHVCFLCSTTQIWILDIYISPELWQCTINFYLYMNLPTYLIVSVLYICHRRFSSGISVSSHLLYLRMEVVSRECMFNEQGPGLARR